MSSATTAPQLGDSVFNGVNDSIPVYIPCGSLLSYRSAWSHFSNFIEVIPYSFSATSADDNMGVVEISNPPTCDNDFTATISAIANPGYHFSGWSDGDTLNPRTIVLTSDTVLEAYFAADIVNYTVTVLSANSEMGAVTGSGIYSEGSSAEISAIANVGYQSLNWDDSKTEKTRIITATSDTTIIANFDVVDRVENVELYV